MPKDALKELKKGSQGKLKQQTAWLQALVQDVSQLDSVRCWSSNRVLAAEAKVCLLVAGGGMSCALRACCLTLISSSAGPVKSPACFSWKSDNFINRICRENLD